MGHKSAVFNSGQEYNLAPHVDHTFIYNWPEVACLSVGFDKLFAGLHTTEGRISSLISYHPSSELRCLLVEAVPTIHTLPGRMAPTLREVNGNRPNEKTNPVACDIPGPITWPGKVNNRPHRQMR